MQMTYTHGLSVRIKEPATARLVSVHAFQDMMVLPVRELRALQTAMVVDIASHKRFLLPKPVVFTPSHGTPRRTSVVSVTPDTVVLHVNFKNVPLELTHLMDMEMRLVGTALAVASVITAQVSAHASLASLALLANIKLT